MRPSFRAVAALVAIPLASASATLAHAGVEVVYGPIADETLMRQLKWGRVGENVRSHLLNFAPNASFTLRLADCGQVNAFYAARAGHREIRLCSELLGHLIEQKGENQGASRREQRAAGGAALWIAGHELGHYLLHRHQLPFLGREEDVADQVGTAILLRSQLSREGVWGVIRYFSRDVAEQDAGDVHSLDATRRVNLACLALGTGQRTYESLTSLIPAHRVAGCKAEFEKFWRGIRALQRSARSSTSR